MTIAEMEPLIDKLGLTKLEVKMKKGRQVHFFICGCNLNAYIQPKSFIIVFDEDGVAWQSPEMNWTVGESFNITEKFYNEVRLLWINGKPMGRYASFDLGKESEL